MNEALVAFLMARLQERSTALGLLQVLIGAAATALGYTLPAGSDSAAAGALVSLFGIIQAAVPDGTVKIGGK